MRSLYVFASGNGSNALNLYRHFQQHDNIRFEGVYCNNPKAGIIEKCRAENIPCRVFNREEWTTGVITDELRSKQADFIVLAGFLWLVPPGMVAAFPNRIINIHPALLPKYGGKGMYGHHVHEAVIRNKETESGITIHLVNEAYDEGAILHQEKLAVHPHDTPDTLASGIHQLEYRWFPVVVEAYITRFK